jgi:hypothetical protein
MSNVLPVNISLNNGDTISLLRAEPKGKSNPYLRESGRILGETNDGKIYKLSAKKLAEAVKFFEYEPQELSSKQRLVEKVGSFSSKLTHFTYVKLLLKILPNDVMSSDRMDEVVFLRYAEHNCAFHSEVNALDGLLKKTRDKMFLRQIPYNYHASYSKQKDLLGEGKTESSKEHLKTCLVTWKYQLQCNNPQLSINGKDVIMYNGFFSNGEQIFGTYRYVFKDMGKEEDISQVILSFGLTGNLVFKN